MTEHQDVVATESQLAVLRAVDEWIHTHGYAPSVRELCDILGIKSTHGVIKILRGLDRDGLIRREVATARALVVTQDGERLLSVERE